LAELCYWINGFRIDIWYHCRCACLLWGVYVSSSEENILLPFCRGNIPCIG
ncbi:hypothetical protein ACJMK2_008171, partial [Sinanodonta woodiana]